jgi:antitoxin ParD1/3/4
VYLHQIVIMARQNISLTEPNDQWLRSEVESGEYSSKSELLNDLIRQARKQQQQVDWLRMNLKEAEKSGFTRDSQEDIRLASKQRFNG